MQIDDPFGDTGAAGRKDDGGLVLSRGRGDREGVGPADRYLLKLRSAPKPAFADRNFVLDGPERSAEPRHNICSRFPGR